MRMLSHCRGDVDGIVPVLSTRRWIKELSLRIISRWRPWYSSTGSALPLHVPQCLLPSQFLCRLMHHTSALSEASL